VQAPELTDQAIQHALASLKQHQPLQASTGATHGAAWCNSAGDILLAREDVGRHNALDKLIGALVKADLPRAGGFALVSSRASYEMVQKSCSAGFGALVAVSAPTALAIEQARLAGLVVTHDHKSTATQVAGGRIYHCQRKLRGYCCIHSVAAFAKYLNADMGGYWVCADNHGRIGD
jgi:formate dehydrogenase accessory protein FdhD